VPSNAPQLGDISFLAGFVVTVAVYLALRPLAAGTAEATAHSAG